MIFTSNRIKKHLGGINVKKQTRRIISLVLSIMLIVSMLSVSASAVAIDTKTSGTAATYNVAGEAGLC